MGNHGNEFTYDVFISYGSRDKAWVRREQVQLLTRPTAALVLCFGCSGLLPLHPQTPGRAP